MEAVEGSRIVVDMAEMSLSDWAVLAVLTEEPRHGFAVSRELARDAPLGAIWRVARPQVYRSLDRLVRAGLAEMGAPEHGEQGPERRVVGCTEAGRLAMTDWATQPVDRLRKVRAELVLKLVICRRLGLDGEALIERQAAVIDTIRTELESALATVSDDRRVALLWRHAAAEAVDRFLTTARGWWRSKAATPASTKPH